MKRSGDGQGKVYPDRRYQFTRILWSHISTVVTRTDQKPVRQSLIKAVAHLGLHPDPIRSAEAARVVPGIGAEWVKVLKKGEAAANLEAPRRGTFASSSAAALVGLLDYEDDPAQAQAHCK